MRSTHTRNQGKQAQANVNDTKACRISSHASNFSIPAVAFSAPTQSPSYAEAQPQVQGSGSLPLSMDPVLAVVSNATGHQVLKKRH
jgi:hypothetical protein